MPLATPVTIPDAVPIPAVPVLLLLQVPVPSVSVAVDPAHIAAMPLIAGGTGFTVTVVLIKHSGSEPVEPIA